MATFITGNQGRAIAGRGQMVNISEAGTQVGRAIENLGATGVQVGVQMAAQQTSLDQQEMRAKMALELATSTNAMRDAAEEVRKGMDDGTVPPEKAGSLFQERTKTLRGQVMERFNPENRTQVETHFLQAESELGRSLDGYATKKRQQGLASTIDQFGEQVMRESAAKGPGWAAAKFGALVDFTGDGAGLNETQRQKLKQSFSERVHADNFSALGMRALENGDVAGLDALRAKLDGADGQPLDPAKRATLGHQLWAWKQQILAGRERASDTALKLAEKEIETAGSFTLDGMIMDPGYQQRLRAATAGTPFAAQAEQLIATSLQGAGFGAQTLPRQRAALQAMEGAPTNPETAKRIAQARTINERQTSAYKADPWEAGSRFARLPDTPEQAIVSGAQLLTIAAQRVPLMPALETASGMPAPLLRPNEVPAMVSAINAMPVTQQGDLLAKTGAMLSGAQTQELAKQLDKTGKPLALALMAGASRTEQGRTASELILRGHQALKDRGVKDDPAVEIGTVASISQAMGDAIPPAARDNVAAAARYIYHAKKAEGTSGSDPFREAVQIAVGGPLVEHNGQTVAVPAGYTAETFGQALRAVKPAEIEAQTTDSTVYVPGGRPMGVAEFVAALPGAKLEPIGLGRYAVRLGGGLVLNDQRRPIVVGIK